MTTYQELKEQVKPTPTVQLPIDVPNKNKIYAKLIYEEGNPNGTHYDMVFPWLFEDAEKNGIPTPNGEMLLPISKEKNHIIEVTTGGAGLSASWVASKMEYDITMVVPENLPRKRIQLMKDYGANIIEAPRKDYIGRAVFNLIEHLGKYDENEKKYVSLNHAFNPLTTNRLAVMAQEACEGRKFDYFVSIAGNGATTLGPGRVFKQHNPNLKLIAVEQFRSGLDFDKLYPEKFEELYDIKPAEMFDVLPQPKDPSRELLGNMGPGTPVPFFDQALEEGLIDDIMLVTDEEMNNAHEKMIDGQVDANKKIENVEKIINWESGRDILEDAGFLVGNTSIAGFTAALELSKKTKNKSYFVYLFDSKDRYL